MMGFEYFRGWLISQGRAFYEATLADPEHAGEGEPDEEGIYECETILYSPCQVLEKLTGREPPISTRTQPPSPAGTHWEEDDLPTLFPQLWKKFE